MSEHPTLSSEELDFIRQLFSTPPNGQPRPTPSFQIDGGPQANALLARLGQHARLSLDAQLGRYRMSFPLHLLEDELHDLQLELGAPSIFEDGTVSRPWRLALDEPLALRNRRGADSGLRVLELSADSLLLGALRAEPPQHFDLWLPLPGLESLPIRGRRIRQAGGRQAAYLLQLRQPEHAERIRQFIFEQYRRRHPLLQIAG